MQISKAKAEQVLSFLEQRRSLRQQPDEADWIALKYSCTYEQAQRMIDAARKRLTAAAAAAE